MGRVCFRAYMFGIGLRTKETKWKTMENTRLGGPHPFFDTYCARPWNGSDGRTSFSLCWPRAGAAIGACPAASGESAARLNLVTAHHKKDTTVLGMRVWLLSAFFCYGFAFLFISRRGCEEQRILMNVPVMASRAGGRKFQ